MVSDGNESLGVLLSSVSQFLKTRNLQLSKSGFKTGWAKHSVDLTTGFWQNPNYSRSKPPRWLTQVFVENGEVKARLPDNAQDINIGMSNTAQGFVAALACKIQPVMQIAAANFNVNEEAEVDVLFVFNGALSKGSSADAFNFEPATGHLSRLIEGKSRTEYVFCALLGITPGNTVVGTTGGIDITYSAILEALQELIHENGRSGVEPINVFDLTMDGAVGDVLERVESAWQVARVDSLASATPQAPADYDDEPSEVKVGELHVPRNPKLLGISDSVYQQVNAALQSGKRHIMLYGPPGTGKTTLAQWIAENLPGSEWTMVTGSADWTSQDIIGGYEPVGSGEIAFVPGILLREFDRPFIIDELNRCDIDKVLGPLFTVLSGHATTLPYRTDLHDLNSPQYTILPVSKSEVLDHEYAPGPAWRMISTINSIDRASLYQMSYALSRRFAWVFIDTPSDLQGFITDFLGDRSDDQQALACPLADAWAAINLARAIGPAPIIDVMKYMEGLSPGVAFFGASSAEAKASFIEAFDMAILPMLDGISRREAEQVASAIVAAFDLGGEHADRIETRVLSAAI